MGLLGSAIGAGINYIFGASAAEHNNALAAKREKEAREANFALNEAAANNADQRTRRLFNDFYSMPAQMMQLKAAGLSPSIFSGGINGMTGTQGAQGSGADGISPNTYGVQPPQINTDMAAVNESISRARLNNAQADELEGENASGEAKITEIYAKIDNLVADTDLKATQRELAAAETFAQELDNVLNSATLGDNIKKVQSLAQKEYHYAQEALYKAGKAQIEWHIANETQDEVIKQIQTETAQKVANILKTLKDIELEEAQIKEIENDIAVKWEQLRIEGINAGTYAISVDNQKEYWEKTLKLKLKELGIKEEELELENTRMIIDAATTVIGIGADLGGTYMMTRSYNKRTQMSGEQNKKTVKFDKHGNFVGGSRSWKSRKPIPKGM